MTEATMELDKKLLVTFTRWVSVAQMKQKQNGCGVRREWEKAKDRASADNPFNEEGQRNGTVIARRLVLKFSENPISFNIST